MADTFLENLSQKIASDPNLQQALMQFGAQVTQPYDSRQGTAVSQTLGALASSADTLKKLRETEKQSAMRQQQADLETQKFGMEKRESEEGSIPLKQAQAEELRARTARERLMLQMTKAQGRTGAPQFDKNIFEAAVTLSGDVMSFDDPNTYRVEIYKNYNRLAAMYGKPIVPTPLEYIRDEDITAAVTSPQAEQLFVKHYGQAGIQRLKAARAKIASTPATAGPMAEAGAAAPGTLPETRTGAGAIGRLLPAVSGSAAANNRELAADDALKVINEGRLGAPPAKDSIGKYEVKTFNAYNRDLNELITRLKAGMESTTDEGKKQLYSSAIIELKKKVLKYGQ